MQCLSDRWEDGGTKKKRGSLQACGRQQCKPQRASWGVKKERCPERGAKNPPLTSEIYFTTAAVRSKLYNVSLELKLLSYEEHRKFFSRSTKIVISRMYNFHKISK